MWITRIRYFAVEGKNGFKGIMFENGIYIAAASSLSKQEELTEKLYRNLQTGKQPAYYLHSGVTIHS